MRRTVTMFSALLALLMSLPVNAAFADGQLQMPIDEVIKKPLLPDDPLLKPVPPISPCDTVWVGFLSTSSDPNRVGRGGKWDFDTAIAGTDSAQFWTFVSAPPDRDQQVYPQPANRPWWYYDYGNNINRGDHKLWKARSAVGRTFRRTGLAGVWHVDDMVGVSSAIAGIRSAWCGLRVVGDALAPTDEYTGNPYTSAEQLSDFRGGGAVRSAFPGYADQWDQLLYRDFTYAGAAIPLSFKYRCQMSEKIRSAIDFNGGGWFTPDPTSPANFVVDPVDRFEVWVGAPKEIGVYDPNRRWLSEVLDFGAASAPVRLVFPGTGQLPGGPPGVGFAVSPALVIPGGKAWGSKVRVVFRVKTNHVESDLKTTAAGFNSVDGAVLLDDVVVGAATFGFEAATDIRPRVLLSPTGVETVIDPTSVWIMTGRPPAAYGHIHNVNDLPYDDPCGGLDGAGARLCNLAGNVLTQGNHDDPGHSFRSESANWAISPTIHVANLGIPKLQISHLNIQFDYYSGFDDPEMTGVFFYYALRYMGSGIPGLLQPVAPAVPAWSPFYTSAALNFFGTPTCLTLDTGTDLAGYVPVGNVDSLQIGLENQVRCARFNATACGWTLGSYWDNIRLGFLTKLVGAPLRTLSTFSWQLLGDTFPSAEDVPPGAVAFDVTTAQMKTGLNNARSLGGGLFPGDGVISGDSLIYVAPGSDSDTRVDLVFRVWPGPGNYSVKGNRLSAPWKDPANPLLGVAVAGDGSWWGQYMLANGAVGSAPSGHGVAFWDPQTWNSARMAQAKLNYFPIPSRGIGMPIDDVWMGAYHAADPKFAALGILHNYCFLVNPDGAADNLNTCCSAAQCAGAPWFEAWPPAAYPGAPTLTMEGTKILPDGLFTPGTHIQYRVRRSKVSDPTLADALSPDPSYVTFQGGMGDDADELRADHVDVLPDLWKDARFAGTGLACILYVDAAERRGVEPAFRRALDDLGYGLDNGAERGWRRAPGNVQDPNNPVHFVDQNLGQAGLAYDKFDIRGAESLEGDRLGCRLAGGGVWPNVAPLQCTQGPSLAMLDYYYNTIIWSAGDVAVGAMHDGSGLGQEQSDDAALITNWLLGAGVGHEKRFWASGDGIAEDMVFSNGASMAGLLNAMGGVFDQASYWGFSANLQPAAVFKPLDAVPGAPDPFHSTRRYGIFNSCLDQLDIIDRDAAVAGAERAARYEQFADRGIGGAGPYSASVYRRHDLAPPGRFFATLLDGFSLHRLRAWGGAGDPQTVAIPLSANSYAQYPWTDDALLEFALCARRVPSSVGEIPGLSAVNFVRGSFPNPSVMGAATVQFTLAQPAKVTIRFYTVAGRLVHEASVDGVAGANNYRWSGSSSTGTRMAAGVYFYRLSAPGIEFQNNGQRMVLLGQAGN